MPSPAEVSQHAIKHGNEHWQRAAEEMTYLRLLTLENILVVEELLEKRKLWVKML